MRYRHAPISLPLLANMNTVALPAAAADSDHARGAVGFGTVRAEKISSVEHSAANKQPKTPQQRRVDGAKPGNFEMHCVSARAAPVRCSSEIRIASSPASLPECCRFLLS